MEENKGLTWPYWPQKLRTSSSHQEGCERQFALATKEFMGENGKVTAVKTCSLIWENGKYSEVDGSEKIYPADLVLLSMGFVSPTQSLMQIFKWKRIVEETLRLVTMVWILTKQTEKMCLQPGMFEEANLWLFGQLGREEKPLRQ